MIEENGPNGFGERPLAGFTHSLDNHLEFYRLALAAYNYRCAISGLQFPPQDKILRLETSVIQSYGPRQ